MEQAKGVEQAREMEDSISLDDPQTVRFLF